ncbi:branched-chain amino acid aminotransferase [Segetibacter sp. 3557_3]|uniref:branched-chain amino acid aminotransferase n=1 Tax=Segetibacter sp. 3557_3 TaxID=2547429 RepID=UPI00105886ED|nr:branched-chain amino acid aminotransferase [Segetibacter sp. 3557_3]TDH25628.1 branched-chain amino acid aminotransferase [Segetibacter sp. 3557_3]
MEMPLDVIVTRTKHSNLEKVNLANPQFGSLISDHMFTCSFNNGQWGEAEVVPFENISMSPATLALHYGQTVFEGLKAFKMAEGSINIFRIEKHHERFNASLDRLCMPHVPKDLFVNALKKLVATDADWIPGDGGGSLYLRPIIFASEARFGVKISNQYRFIIFGGPVGNYFQEPLKVKVERKYNRAAKGGTGYAKCAGNYAGAFYPTRLAQDEGYDQVLWTDSKLNEYVEELGMMNAMFVIDGKLVTPPLSDSILDGITRDSLLKIARGENIETEERDISITELQAAFKEQRITEAFGAGTAAVVAPIAVIAIDGVDYHLPEYGSNNLMFRLKQRLGDIRTGAEADTYGWNYIVSAQA